MDESYVVCVDETRTKFERGLINREEMNLSLADTLVRKMVEENNPDDLIRALISALITGE